MSLTTNCNRRCTLSRIKTSITSDVILFRVGLAIFASQLNNKLKVLVAISTITLDFLGQSQAVCRISITELIRLLIRVRSLRVDTRITIQFACIIRNNSHNQLNGLVAVTVGNASVTTNSFFQCIFVNTRSSVVLRQVNRNIALCTRSSRSTCCELITSNRPQCGRSSRTALCHNAIAYLLQSKRLLGAGASTDHGIDLGDCNAGMVFQLSFIISMLRRKARHCHSCHHSNCYDTSKQFLEFHVDSS